MLKINTSIFLLFILLVGCSTNQEKENQHNIRIDVEPQPPEEAEPLMGTERPERLSALDLYKEWYDGFQVAATLFGINDERIVILDIWPPADEDGFQSLQFRRWIKSHLKSPGHTETINFGDISIEIHLVVINDKMDFKVDVIYPKTYPVVR